MSRRNILSAANANLLALQALGGDTPLLVDSGGVFQPGVIAAANASRFTETFFDEPLTTYAVGFKDPNDIEATLEFFAPMTPTPERFTYKTTSSAEEFLSDADDIRAIGAPFKVVPYSGSEVEARTYNKGLTVIIDRKQQTPGWEQRTVARLLRRLWRNDLRRAIALLSAAATNTAKTWDTTAGKDPDQDVISELVAAATASGIRPNRIGYGDTAWSRRSISHRAQETAGGFASAMLTPQQLAQLLGVDEVRISKERYQTGAATKAEILNNLVLMFMALGGGDLEDASNIKRFVSPVEGGGNVRVFVQELGPHLVAVTVEHNSNIAITSTLGIRKFTVS